MSEPEHASSSPAPVPPPGQVGQAARTEEHVETARELDDANEALRVSQDKVRDQQEQIDELVGEQDTVRGDQERAMAVLPVPMLTTDGAGVIRSVNPAAAVLLEMRVSRLIGTRLVSLFEPARAATLRAGLDDLHGGETVVHTSALLVRRGQPPLDVDVTATATANRQVVSWMLVSTADDAGSGRESLNDSLRQLTVLTSTDDLQETLGAAVALCRQALGRDVEVSVGLGSPRTPQATSNTADWAQEVDGAQMRVDEGPGLTAFDTTTTVVTPEVRTDPRWPRLAAHLPKELGGVVAVPLDFGDEQTGVLSVYRRSTGRDPVLHEATELLSATLEAVLHQRDMRSELASLADDMSRALESRAVIDQAKGVLMAERGWDADTAFAHLLELSNRHGIKVRDLASRIIEQMRGRG